MPGRFEPTQRLAHVLDVSPDLGGDLTPAELLEAQRVVTAPLIELDAGHWDPGSAATDDRMRGRLLGLLVVEGLIVREISLAGRTSTQLYGPRDLLGLHHGADASLPVASTLSVPGTASVAVLDDRLLAAMRRWPRIAGRFFDQGMVQVDRASAHQAISQLPRVEDRLVALLWHLADRWGRVRPDGVLIDLALTHEALGRLVGARRPTVSLGLQSLAERALVRREANGSWLLATDSIDALVPDALPAQSRSALLAPREASSAEAPVAPQPPAGTLDRDALRARMAQLRATMQERERRTEDALARVRTLRAAMAERRDRMPHRTREPVEHDN